LKPNVPNAKARPPAPSGTAALAVLFFFSGALALMYEVVWHRQFALLLGSAAPATAAVLAAYFAGLGAGSYVLGRMAGRWSNPLRVYAVLEVLIAAGALLVLAMQAGFERAYPWIFSALAGRPAGFFVAKLALVFVALLLPTFCMGGTLPILGALVDRGPHRLGVTAGLLYVANTAGASLGALCVPFALLPLLGGFGTTGLCIAGNLLLALIAWRWSGRPDNVPAKEVSSARSAPQKTVTGPAIMPVLPLAFLSGGATFALQVLWNRAFAQVHENSVHAFALIVAVVILALALGAQLARVGLRRGLTPGWLMPASWGLAGLGVIIGPWLFVWLTDGLAYLSADRGWPGHARQLLGLTAAVVLVPMTLLGIGLPALLDEAGRGARHNTASIVLGRVLAVNVAGSVAGALLAGFVLPRWLGMWNAMVLTGVLLTLAAVYLLARQPPERGQPERGRWRRATAFAVLTELALLSGLVVLVLADSKTGLPRVQIVQDQGEQLVALAEGAHGITAVVDRPGSRRLKLNNHYVLGGTASTGDERMQTHLPLLLHPAPRSVAYLGLGTGITAGGVLFHPFERATLIELVPEVVAAAREHFAAPNAGVLADPRVTVVTDDARNFLRGANAQFDVIIGDLVVPWRQGEGALFTLESFTAARDSLADGGLFCQWVPCFQLSATELRIILRTFLEVFPEATIWRGDFSPTDSALALMGWRGGARVEPATIRRRLRAMTPDPANAHFVRPGIVWMHYLGPLTADAMSGLEVPLNTDVRPVIELLGPLRRGADQARLLTGRRLQRWLAESLAAHPKLMGELDADERSGVSAGKLFEEMVLLIAEGNGQRAREVQGELRATLPAGHFSLLFP